MLRACMRPIPPRSVHAQEIISVVHIGWGTVDLRVRELAATSVADLTVKEIAAEGATDRQDTVGRHAPCASAVK